MIDHLSRPSVVERSVRGMPNARPLPIVTRALANINAELQVHPGRHHTATDAAQDAWLALADRRLDLESEFRVALEAVTGVNTALLAGAL
jgi:hypothetical protein